jgi:serine/threonine protein kinase
MGGSISTHDRKRLLIKVFNATRSSDKGAQWTGNQLLAVLQEFGEDVNSKGLISQTDLVRALNSKGVALSEHHIALAVEHFSVAPTSGEPVLRIAALISWLMTKPERSDNSPTRANGGASWSPRTANASQALSGARTRIELAQDFDSEIRKKEDPTQELPALDQEAAQDQPSGSAGAGKHQHLTTEKKAAFVPTRPPSPSLNNRRGSARRLDQQQQNQKHQVAAATVAKQEAGLKKQQQTSVAGASVSAGAVEASAPEAEEKCKVEELADQCKVEELADECEVEELACAKFIYEAHLRLGGEYLWIEITSSVGSEQETLDIHAYASDGRNIGSVAHHNRYHHTPQQLLKRLRLDGEVLSLDDELSAPTMQAAPPPKPASTYASMPPSSSDAGELLQMLSKHVSAWSERGAFLSGAANTQAGKQLKVLVANGQQQPLLAQQLPSPAEGESSTGCILVEADVEADLHRISFKPSKFEYAEESVLGPYRIKIVQPQCFGGANAHSFTDEQLSTLRQVLRMRREYQSDHVADIYDLGVAEDRSMAWYVMEELCPDKDEQSTDTQGSFPIREEETKQGEGGEPHVVENQVVKVGIAVLKGLSAMHAVGQVHGAIDPSHIVQSSTHNKISICTPYSFAGADYRFRAPEQWREGMQEGMQVDVRVREEGEGVRYRSGTLAKDEGSGSWEVHYDADEHDETSIATRDSADPMTYHVIGTKGVCEGESGVEQGRIRVHCGAWKASQQQELDERTDVWLVSAVLFFLISGKFPFQGSSKQLGASSVETPVELRRGRSGEAGRSDSGESEMAVMLQVLEGERVPQLVDCDAMGNEANPIFSEVLHKGMQRDKAKRWQSAEEMIEALQHVVTSKGDVWFHVFLSYRVALERDLLPWIYKDLKTRKIRGSGGGASKDSRLRPYWDKVCIKMGNNWKDDFLGGLLHSQVFVPVVTTAVLEGIIESSNKWADNVLLEWMLALVLFEQGKIKAIMPIFTRSTLIAKDGTPPLPGEEDMTNQQKDDASDELPSHGARYKAFGRGFLDTDLVRDEKREATALNHGPPKTLEAPQLEEERLEEERGLKFTCTSTVTLPDHKGGLSQTLEAVAEVVAKKLSAHHPSTLVWYSVNAKQHVSVKEADANEYGGSCMTITVLTNEDGTNSAGIATRLQGLTASTVFWADVNQLLNNTEKTLINVDTVIANPVPFPLELSKPIVDDIRSNPESEGAARYIDSKKEEAQHRLFSVKGILNKFLSFDAVFTDKMPEICEVPKISPTADWEQDKPIESKQIFQVDPIKNNTFAKEKADEMIDKTRRGQGWKFNGEWRSYGTEHLTSYCEFEYDAALHTDGVLCSTEGGSSQWDDHLPKAIADIGDQIQQLVETTDLSEDKLALQQRQEEDSEKSEIGRVPAKPTAAELFGPTLLKAGGYQAEFKGEVETLTLQREVRHWIVYFGGKWCPHCTTFLPSIKKVSLDFLFLSPTSSSPTTTSTSSFSSPLLLLPYHHHHLISSRSNSLANFCSLTSSYRPFRFFMEGRRRRQHHPRRAQAVLAFQWWCMSAVTAPTTIITATYSSTGAGSPFPTARRHVLRY